MIDERLWDWQDVSVSKRVRRVPVTSLFRGEMARAVRYLLLAAIVFVGSVAEASPITVTVNTGLISGISAQLAFDLIDGGPGNNSVGISGFSTNGTLGKSLLTGGAS